MGTKTNPAAVAAAHGVLGIAQVDWTSNQDNKPYPSGLPPIFSCTVLGRPVPWARMRTFGKRRFKPERQAAGEGRIRRAAAWWWKGKPLIIGPVHVKLTFVFQVPQRWPKAKRQLAATGGVPHVSVPDADNLMKLIGDSLSGIVLRDDRQITSAEIRKLYGNKALTEIELYELPNEAATVG